MSPEQVWGLLELSNAPQVFTPAEQLLVGSVWMGEPPFLQASINLSLIRLLTTHVPLRTHIVSHFEYCAEDHYLMIYVFHNICRVKLAFLDINV